MHGVSVEVIKKTRRRPEKSGLWRAKPYFATTFDKSTVVKEGYVERRWFQHRTSTNVFLKKLGPNPFLNISQIYTPYIYP